MTWRRNTSDTEKLARWIRCLFQLALGQDESTSLHCLDHAATIAAKAKVRIISICIHLPRHLKYCYHPPATQLIFPQDFNSQQFPSVELEWLATTSFNRAVDYYVQENDTKCKLWAEKAISLSHWANDRGALEKLLIEKYQGLTWD